MNQSLVIALIPYVVPFLVALAVAFGKLLLDKLPTAQRQEASALIQAAVLAADHMSPGDQDAADALIGQVLSAAHVKVPAPVVQAFTHAALSSLPPVDPSPPHVGFVPNVSPELAPSPASRSRSL
jgi:hypothetical protein